VGLGTQPDASSPASPPLDAPSPPATAMEGVADEGRTPTTRDAAGTGGGEAVRRRPSNVSDATATDGELIDDHTPADVINYTGKYSPIDVINR